MGLLNRLSLTNEGEKHVGIRPKTDGVGNAGPYFVNDAARDSIDAQNTVASIKLADSDTAALKLANDSPIKGELPAELPKDGQDFHDARLLGDPKQEGAGREAKGPVDKVRRWCSEGHTAWDAFLSTACSAVGQVILTYPYQLALMGIIPGIFIGIGVGLLNFYTLYLLIILYLQRKQTMVRAGTWYNGIGSNGYLRRRTATQYHDVVGFALGRFLGGIGQFLVALYILGVAIQQVVASSSSQYAIDKHYNKRDWSLILGAPILVFGLLPSFRSVRLLNLIALVGTNYSCLYFFVTAVSAGAKPGIITRGPQSIQGFFLGAAVVGSAGHGISMEMMDGMRRSRYFTYASFFGWVWNIILLLPHSIAVVLAYPEAILKQANVYSVLPASGWKQVSVYLMLIHNIGAFTLHTNPLLYMWEKIIHTHHLAWYIRIPSRLPVLAVIWVLSLAIPFYGTINSLFSAFSIGITAFVLPCLAFNVHYRKESRRRDCPVQPPWPLNKWGWKPMFAVNIFLGCLFLGTSTGCGIYYSIKQLISNIHTFSWFAACYQCTAPAAAHGAVPIVAHAPSAPANTG